MQLGGWDSLATLHRDMVNQLLEADRDLLPMQMSQRAPRVNIAFGPWQVVDGSCGAQVQIEIPVRSGLVDHGPDHLIPLAGLRIGVALALKIRRSAAEIRLTFAGPAQQVAVLGAAGHLSATARETVSGAVCGALNAAMDDCQFTLARITPGTRWFATGEISVHAPTKEAPVFAILGRRDTDYCALPPLAPMAQAGAVIGLSARMAADDRVRLSLGRALGGATRHDFPVIWPGARDFSPCRIGQGDDIILIDDRPI